MDNEQSTINTVDVLIFEEMLEKLFVKKQISLDIILPLQETCRSRWEKFRKGVLFSPENLQSMIQFWANQILKNLHKNKQAWKPYSLILN